jgi:hypothetical protein
MANSRSAVSEDGLEMRTSPWLGVVWPGAVTVRSSTRITRGCGTAHAHAAAQHRRPRRASSCGQPARGASIPPSAPRLPAQTVWFRRCVHAAAPGHESRPATRCQPLRSCFQSDQWSDPRPDRGGDRERDDPNPEDRSARCRPDTACGDSDPTVDKVLGQTGLLTVPPHPFGQQRLRRDGDRIIRDPIVDQRELELNSMRRDRASCRSQGG